MKLLLLGLVVLITHHVNSGVPRALTDQQRLQQLATATSMFSFDLYNKFSATNKNLIISPISVFTALAMLSLGSKGQTMDEIYKTLNIEHLGSDVHHAFQYYNSMLQGLSNVTLNNANGMFVRPGTKLLADFSNKMQTYYDAKAQNFDFNNPKGPEAPINDWVSKQTAGMIKDFLQPGSVDGSTVMWLINAIYFKEKQKFHVDKTTSVDVDMMNLSHLFRYKRLETLRATVVELPYVGYRYSLYILLPDNIEGLSALESRLNPTRLENALQNLVGPSFVDLSLPKFSVKFKVTLNTALQQMGLKQIFSGADLSGITGHKGIIVSEVVQQAVIEISEEGTKAAAVTGIMTMESLNPIKAKRIEVNRPFMFVLRDQKTNTNLFMGRYSKPENSNGAPGGGDRILNGHPGRSNEGRNRIFTGDLGFIGNLFMRIWDFLNV